MKQFSALIAMSFLFAACASTPKNETFEPIPMHQRAALNFDDIQNRLGIDSAPGHTGYVERTFDACDLGEALNDLNEPLRDCHHAYFVMVQVQLSCRQSEDTSNVLTENDLSPVRNQTLTWKIGKLTGKSDTDYAGSALLRTLSSTSAKKSYLRISTGTDFLMMRAEQAGAIVTPPSWCGSH